MTTIQFSGGVLDGTKRDYAVPFSQLREYAGKGRSDLYKIERYSKTHGVGRYIDTLPAPRPNRKAADNAR